MAVLTFFSPVNKTRFEKTSAFIPFTVPVCKVYGLKDARTHLQRVIFSGPVTHLLSMLCILMEIFSYACAMKKTKRFKGFKFGTSFQASSWQ